jgi:hypothetical protein
MTALMFSSLGTYRGAHALSHGVPEAAATLYHKRRVCPNAVANFGSILWPLRFARRKIPRQFAAVKKELVSAV